MGFDAATLSPGALPQDEEAGVAILCPQCLEPNPEDRHFCRRCATPLTSYAAIDPLGSIYAAADTYRKAIANPRSPIVLIGMWLLFGPTALISLLILCAGVGSVLDLTSGSSGRSVLYAMGPSIVFLEAAIACAILYRLTRNRLRLSHEPLKNGEQGRDGAGQVIRDNAIPAALAEGAAKPVSADEASPNAAAELVDNSEPFLLSDVDLRPTDDEVLRLIQAERDPYAFDPTDPIYGSAFRHYLLFANWPYLVHRDLNVELDDESVFYNRFYWFTLFSNLYQAGHGQEAGLEQEAMLEEAGGKIDAAAIERIEQRARNEAAAAVAAFTPR